MTYCTYDTNCQKPIIIKKLIEENEQLKQENEQLKAQNEKMQCCFNCKHYNQVRCCRNDDKCIWELVE